MNGGRSLDDFMKPVQKPITSKDTLHTLLESYAWEGISLTISHRQGKCFMRIASDAESDEMEIAEPIYRALLPYSIDKLSDDKYCKRYGNAQCKQCDRRDTCELRKNIAKIRKEGF